MIKRNLFPPALLIIYLHAPHKQGQKAVTDDLSTAIFLADQIMHSHTKGKANKAD